MVALSRDQVNEFLKGAYVARIGTVGSEGEPHVTPVWFWWNGEAIYVIGRTNAFWIERVARNSRIAFLIDDVGPPDFKISIEGMAQILKTDWVATARKMCIKHLGEKAGTAYLNDTLDQPRLLVKVTARKTTTWYVPSDKAAGKERWHPRYYEPGSKWYNEYNEEKKAKKK